MDLRQALRVSGISYLLIFITGFYANFSVLETMVVPMDAESTAINFIHQHPLLRMAILGFVVMLIFDITLVGSLYFVTNKVNRTLTIMASGFRLLHAIAFGVALTSLIHIYQLTGNSMNMDLARLQPKIISLLENFDTIWALGLLLFGAHLAFLGYLSIKSNLIPKGLGFLLLFAAMGYLADCSAKLFMSNYVGYQQFFGLLVVLFGVMGELSFTVWLLIRGFGKHPKENLGHT